jgi:1,4-alpha-glucan branching enzyme
MLNKMPGDRWQKFANLRAYYGFMFGHPGKKLLFMGNEFAQAREWDHDSSLDWHLNHDPLHAGVQALVRDLNGVLRECAALHQLDFHHEGFEWMSHGDAAHSTLAFVRRGIGAQSLLLVVCNFTPVVRRGWRVGVPRAGRWRERINTESTYSGGSNVGTPLGVAESQPVGCDGRGDSIVVELPPLATVMFEWVA